MAAREFFSARNFHELNQWRDRTIAHFSASHDNTLPDSQAPFGNIATCTFCGCVYCPSVKEDQKLHRARHDRFEEATSALGYMPDQYAEIETRKKIGQSQMSSSDLHICLAGALDVLRGWFDRSLNSAIEQNYWKQHPDFSRYVSYLTGNLPGFPPAVIPILIDQYGREDGVIKPGKPYWYPPK